MTADAAQHPPPPAPPAPPAAPAAPAHPVRARVMGVVLLMLGGVCASVFNLYSSGTLARYGFPRAWSGAPVLLGAVFCGVVGGFLLAQRRFSLGALLAAGIAAAAVAAGAQAYVMSIHAAATEEFGVYVAEDKRDAFELRLKQLLSPERLMALANALMTDSARPRQLDFNAASVSVSTAAFADPPLDGYLRVTIAYDYSPFLNDRPTALRSQLGAYCQFAATYAVAEGSLSGRPSTVPNLASISAARLAGKVLSEGYTPPPASEGLVLNLREFLHPHALINAVDAPVEIEARHSTILWLRDHEPDPRLKQFFSDVLSMYDGSAGKPEL